MEGTHSWPWCGRGILHIQSVLSFSEVIGEEAMPPPPHWLASLDPNWCPASYHYISFRYYRDVQTYWMVKQHTYNNFQRFMSSKQMWTDDISVRYILSMHQISYIYLINLYKGNDWYSIPVFLNCWALASIIPGPRLKEKRIYQATVWQRLRTTVLYHELYQLFKRTACDSQATVTPCLHRYISTITEFSLPF
jgi:hypothetical protein